MGDITSQVSEWRLEIRESATDECIGRRGSPTTTPAAHNSLPVNTMPRDELGSGGEFIDL